jgi:hypothetical protein
VSVEQEVSIQILTNEGFITNVEDYVGGAKRSTFIFMSTKANGDAEGRCTQMSKDDVRSFFKQLLDEMKDGEYDSSLPIGMTRTFFIGKKASVVGDLLLCTPSTDDARAATVKRLVREAVHREAAELRRAVSESKEEGFTVMTSDRIGTADLGGRKKRDAVNKTLDAMFEPAPEGVNPFQPGSVVVMDIFHDDWCGHFRGTGCDCSPDMKPRVLKEGVL